jgi:two-component system, response regulator RegA
MSGEKVVRPSVLLVDDDQTFRARLARAFSERGYEVREAGSAKEAVAIASTESPEHAVVDLKMPGESGLFAVRELHRIDPATKIVVLTGYGSIATALEAVRLGATHYLGKPADVEEIEAGFRRDEKAGDPSVDVEVPSLARVEWEHIDRVMADVGGNVSQAARLLGLHRRSLQRKLQKRPVKR